MRQKSTITVVSITDFYALRSFGASRDARRCTFLKITQSRISSEFYSRGRRLLSHAKNEPDKGDDHRVFPVTIVNTSTLYLSTFGSLLRNRELALSPLKIVINRRGRYYNGNRFHNTAALNEIFEARFILTDVITVTPSMHSLTKAGLCEQYAQI